MKGGMEGPKFEKNEKKKPLSESAAREEANMMRAFVHKERDLDSHPLDREWPSFLDRFEDHYFKLENAPAPTKEEYDRAAQAIDSLRELAEKEPAAVKALYGFGRMLHGAARIPGFFAWSIEQGIMRLGGEAPMNKFHNSKGRTWSEPDPGMVGGIDELVRHYLTDAQEKLQEMQAAGKAYGKYDRGRDERLERERKGTEATREYLRKQDEIERDHWRKQQEKEKRIKG